MPNNLDKDLRESFYKEFANSYAGDSGLGGNTPQDPIFEMATDNPKDIADWWLSHFKSLLTEVLPEEKVDPWQSPYNMDMTVGFNACLTTIKSKIAVWK